jgi:hypothetical protein
VRPLCAEGRDGLTTEATVTMDAAAEASYSIICGWGQIVGRVHSNEFDFPRLTNCG